MSKLSLFASAILLALLPAAGAEARDQLGQRDEVVVEPDRAYIFYRSGSRFDVRLLREVDAAQRAAHEEARRAAFPRALARNEAAIARWNREQESCRGYDRFSAACQNRPPRPEPLTYESFQLPPPELDNFVLVMGGRRFTRGEGENGYFIAVEPGTYMLYGHATLLPSGSAGVCLCMGSVKFEARAGQIVDLGYIDSPEEEEEAGRFLPASLAVRPADDSSSRPERLAALPVVRAELRAADKVPNYFALQIDRHPAVPGVLGYERDRVLDLRAAAPTDPTP